MKTNGTEYLTPCHTAWYSPNQLHLRCLVTVAPFPVLFHGNESAVKTLLPVPRFLLNLQCCLLNISKGKDQRLACMKFSFSPVSCVTSICHSLTLHLLCITNSSTHSTLRPNISRVIPQANIKQSVTKLPVGIERISQFSSEQQSGLTQSETAPSHIFPSCKALSQISFSEAAIPNIYTTSTICCRLAHFPLQTPSPSPETLLHLLSEKV